MTARRLAAVPDIAPRFAIAVRVSRVGGRSGERFLSPEIQVDAARRAVAQVGGVVDETVGDAGVFYDLDVSGATAPADRPGLGQALELVQAGRLSGVALYDLSRFSRDTSGGLRALEDIADAGGQVLSASESIDLDTPAGLFSTTVQLAAHKLRRDEASRGWKATHARRFELGLPHGKVPLGYVSDSGGAAVDPILGPALTQAFTEYAAGMVSQKDLAARLGTLRGKPMRQGVISQLLRNRFYLGEVTFLDQTRPGRHTPLVDPATFDIVQARLVDGRATGPHGHVPRSPVIGLVFCAVCHRPLYHRGQGERGGERRPSRLICAGKMAGLCEGVGAPRVDELAPAVRDLALEVAADLRDDTPSQQVRSSKAARARALLASLEGEEKELLNAIGRAGVANARRLLSDEATAQTVGQLEVELAAVRARLGQVKGAERHAVRPAAELATAAERLEQLWPFLQPLEARSYLQVFVPAVRVRRAAYRGEPMRARLSLPQDEE